MLLNLSFPFQNSTLVLLKGNIMQIPWVYSEIQDFGDSPFLITKIGNEILSGLTDLAGFVYLPSWRLDPSHCFT